MPPRDPRMPTAYLNDFISYQTKVIPELEAVTVALQTAPIHRRRLRYAIFR